LSFVGPDFDFKYSKWFYGPQTTRIGSKPGFIPIYLSLIRLNLFVGPDFNLKTFKWFYGPQITGIAYKQEFIPSWDYSVLVVCKAVLIR